MRGKQLGIFFENGIVQAKEFIGEKLSVKEVETEKLCVGRKCVTEKELEMLENQGVENQGDALTSPRLDKPGNPNSPRKADLRQIFTRVIIIV